MHLQTKFSQGKYLSVLKGEISWMWLLILEETLNFGKYFSIKLSDQNGKALTFLLDLLMDLLALKRKI